LENFYECAKVFEKPPAFESTAMHDVGPDTKEASITYAGEGTINQSNKVKLAQQTEKLNTMLKCAGPLIQDSIDRAKNAPILDGHAKTSLYAYSDGLLNLLLKNGDSYTQGPSQKGRTRSFFDLYSPFERGKKPQNTDKPTNDPYS
jgi:hypothetical protein